MLFTFPSRYWFTIGHQQCLALGDGPPGFRRGCTCPVVLRKSAGANWFSPTGLSPSLAGFPVHSTNQSVCNSVLPLLQPPVPRRERGLGYFPLRSPLLGESRLLSFPPVTKMFQFTGFPLPVLYIQYGSNGLSDHRVSPFGDFRI